MKQYTIPAVIFLAAAIITLSAEHYYTSALIMSAAGANVIQSGAQMAELARATPAALGLSLGILFFFAGMRVSIVAAIYIALFTLLIALSSLEHAFSPTYDIVRLMLAVIAILFPVISALSLFIPEKPQQTAP